MSNQGPQIIYKRDVTIYRPDIRIELKAPDYKLPTQRLPKEADGQTPTPTPAGKSIDLKKALPDREFGRLLYTPVSDKELELRKIDKNTKFEFADRLELKQEEAIKRYAQHLAFHYEGIEPEDKLYPWDCNCSPQ